MYILRAGVNGSLIEVKARAQMTPPMLLLIRQARPAPNLTLMSVSQAVSVKMAPPVMPAPTVQPPVSTASKSIKMMPEMQPGGA
jgi:hypothetical protein